MKLMVLNDGETYTSLAGCKLVEVPDNMDPNDIEEVLDSISGLTHPGLYGARGAKILRVFNGTEG